MADNYFETNLEKHFDTMLVGRNYLSFILGIQALEEEKRVLLLDDVGVQFGDLFTNSFGQVEKNFLQLLGQKSRIDPLINIEEYLVRKPVTLVFNNKRVQLGELPSRNLLEIARKLSACLRQEDGQIFLSPVKNQDSIMEFNHAYDSYCPRLAQYIFQSGETEHLSGNLSLENLLLHCPKNIKDIFNIFRTAVKSGNGLTERERNLLQIFLYTARAFYQKRFSLNSGGIDFFLLFLSILSPQYNLDHERLLIDLEQVYLDRGGQLKQTTVDEWFFYKRRPWGIVLNSFEGVVHPKKIAFLGKIPPQASLTLKPLSKSFSCIKTTFQINKESNSLGDGERILFCDLEKMGTDFPLWEAVRVSDKIEIKMFVRKKMGSKIDFYLFWLKKLIKQDLASLCLEGEFGEFELDSEIWIDEHWGALEQRKNREVKVVDISDLNRARELKDVNYLGPYSGVSFGLLSSLIQVEMGTGQ